MTDHKEQSTKVERRVRYRILAIDQYGDADEVSCEDGPGSLHRTMRVWDSLKISDDDPARAYLLERVMMVGSDAEDMIDSYSVTLKLHGDYGALKIGGWLCDD